MTAAPADSIAVLTALSNRLGPVRQRHQLLAGLAHHGAGLEALLAATEASAPVKGWTPGELAALAARRPR
jgi:hypothetical protein